LVLFERMCMYLKGWGLCFLVLVFGLILEDDQITVQISGFRVWGLISAQSSTMCM
jgi:hypothetical protein